MADLLDNIACFGMIAIVTLRELSQIYDKI